MRKQCTEQFRRIPYGVSDFVSVRERDLYYVDKTMYLTELEKKPDTLIFIRPRRFGKSLFISMMRAYYDKSMEERFDRLFGTLWIGTHSTPLRNHYQVLYLDFSRIQGNIDSLEKSFNSYCCDQLNDFIDTYREDYPKEQVEELRGSTDAGQKLNLLNNMSKKHGRPLFLLIDEYDNFTNVVLSEHGEDIYHKMTHADGFYRDLFKKFKGMFERIFITGVSPVTLDDLTSGFFLLPDLTHYQAGHSYIIELKYLSKSAYTPEVAEQQWQTAVEQIHRYAVAPRVELLRQGTKLHNIIMQFVGWELVRMEEV